MTLQSNRALAANITPVLAIQFTNKHLREEVETPGEKEADIAEKARAR